MWLNELNKAVLEQAKSDLSYIHCVTTSSYKGKQKIAEEALDWLLSDEVDWPFTFINLCQSLNLDPSATRVQIARDLNIEYLLKGV